MQLPLLCLLINMSSLGMFWTIYTGFNLFTF